MQFSCSSCTGIEMFCRFILFLFLGVFPSSFCLFYCPSLIGRFDLENNDEDTKILSVPRHVIIIYR